MKSGRDRIPLGLASKLESAKETLPSVEVGNKVLYVNRDLDLPFNLEVGKSTNLGVFLSEQVEDVRKSRPVEVSIHHGRSAILGRVIFGEKAAAQGRQLFRDIDIKGLGYVLSNDRDPKVPSVGDIRIQEPNPDKSWGILNSEDAYRDKEYSEMLRSYGIRAHRVVAIIALEEIIYQGARISIAEAKRRKLLPQTSEPVLEIRAFGTRTRLMDIFHNDLPTESYADGKLNTKRRLLMEDARELVAQEFGEDPSKFDAEGYFRWLARMMGKNLGLLHKNGWVNNFVVDGHNITLDGRLVDFESVRHVGPGSNDEYSRDDSATFLSLRRLLSISEFRYPMYNHLVEEILKEYEKSYEEAKNS